MTTSSSTWTAPSGSAAVATARAPEAIAAIREAGKRLAFVTNDGSRSPEEYVQKLWSIGCTAAVEEIVSVGSALQYVLAERPSGASVYVIGAPPSSDTSPMPDTASSTTPTYAESADWWSPSRTRTSTTQSC